MTINIYSSLKCLNHQLFHEAFSYSNYNVYWVATAILQNTTLTYNTFTSPFSTAFFKDLMTPLSSGPHPSKVTMYLLYCRQSQFPCTMRYLLCCYHHKIQHSHEYQLISSLLAHI